jgi:DNA-directed RNA polymerase beta subunit
LFDHVNAIRREKDPNYYNNLSEEDRKTFNHFMILRALSMDSSIVEEMASLYQVFDKIPSPQFYQLLIALVPKDFRFYKWVKTKKMKHKIELLKIVADRFKVSQFEANDYVNILLRTDEGQDELVSICRAFGINEKEIEKIFEVESKEE